MALVELTGRTREERGKGAAHRLRQSGYLPGVVYGPGEDTVSIAVEARSFEKVLRLAVEGTVLIDLRLGDAAGGELKVLIKEVQRDPATSRALHVDFFRISMDRPVRLSVPVRLTGVSQGVKNEGGFLEHVLRELEVECLPAHVPEVIELDVSDLHIGDALHAGDVVREGVAVQTPPDRVVAAVHGRTAAALAEEAAEAEAAEAQAAAAETAEKAPAGEGESSSAS